MTNPGRPAPRVSVVVPTYNRADLLPQAIDSVLRQAFVSFELLVVDDGSTDDTDRVVARFEDDRILYLRQPHSGLPAVARNTGMRRARGEFIAFLDSDDLWLPEKLACQVEQMDARPELGLVYANAYRFVDDPRQHDPRDLLLKPGQGVAGEAFERLYGRPVIPNLTVMIRSSVVAKTGLFDEDPRLKANEDYDYWLRIAHEYSIGYLDRPLALYRHHAQGISKATLATYQAKLFLLEKLDRAYPEFVARHPEKRSRWLATIHYGLGRELLRGDRAMEARSHLRQSWAIEPRPATLLFLAAAYLGKGVYGRLDGAMSRRQGGGR